MNKILKTFSLLLLGISVNIFAADKPCDINLTNVIDDALDSELSLTETSDALKKGYKGRLNEYADSPDIKALRWEEYQRRDGTAGWEFDRWSNNYDLNQSRWRIADVKVDEYWESIGNIGRKEVAVDNLPDDFDAGRRLDIGDDLSSPPWGIEVKSGYATLNVKIRQQLNVDRYLQNEARWNISWYFDGTASKPLLDALDEAGIPYSFRDIVNNP